MLKILLNFYKIFANLPWFKFLLNFCVKCWSILSGFSQNAAFSENCCILGIRHGVSWKVQGTVKVWNLNSTPILFCNPGPGVQDGWVVVGPFPLFILVNGWEDEANDTYFWWWTIVMLSSTHCFVLLVWWAMVGMDVQESADVRCLWNGFTSVRTYSSVSFQS